MTCSFNISSSLTTPSTILLLPASKTTTFHCEDNGLSLVVVNSQSGKAYFSSSCRPDSLKNDYDVKRWLSRILYVVLLTFLLYRDCRGSHGCGATRLCYRIRGSDECLTLGGQPTAAIFRFLVRYFETSLEPPNVDSDSNSYLVSSIMPK